jgi:hypothetical protein
MEREFITIAKDYRLHPRNRVLPDALKRIEQSLHAIT